MLTLKISSARCLVLAMVCGFPFSSYRITPSNIFQCCLLVSSVNYQVWRPQCYPESRWWHTSPPYRSPRCCPYRTNGKPTSACLRLKRRKIVTWFANFSSVWDVHLYLCLQCLWPSETLWNPESRCRQNRRFERHETWSLRRFHRERLSGRAPSDGALSVSHQGTLSGT